MANYSGNVAVNQTLTANTVDAVTLSSTGSGVGTRNPGVTVVNITGTDALYFTVSCGGNAQSPDPTVAGTDCYVVPAVVGASVAYPATTAPVIVKLISTGAMAYSVEAL